MNRAIALFAFVALSSWFPVKIFSLKDRLWITLSDVFVFGALFQFGLEVAVILVSVEALSFLLRTRPKRCYRWLFNFSQPVVSIFLIGQLHWFLTNTDAGGYRSPLHFLIIGMTCGFIYFTMGSGLTSLAVSLTSHQPFGRLFRKNISWFVPAAMGAGIASAIYLLAT